MKQISLILFTAALAAAQIFAQGPNDAAAAMGVVDQLFDGMKAKDAERIRSLFTAEAQLVAMDKPSNGEGLSKTRVFTGETFAKTISEAKAGVFVEKMLSPNIHVDGDLAVITGRYTFFVADKFSHCGTNTFNLVRTASGWKIANGVSTLEFQCQRDLRAVDVPVIEADMIDVSTIDGIVKAFYETISGAKGIPRQWARDRTLYTPDVRFVAMRETDGKVTANIFNHKQYVNATNGLFVGEGFTERELNRVVRRFGNIAHVFSTYEYNNDSKADRGRGVNSIELYWDGVRWWISSASWDEERPNNPIPKEFLPKRKSR